MSRCLIPPSPSIISSYTCVWKENRRVGFLPCFSYSSLLLLASGLGRSYNVGPEELRASVSGDICLSRRDGKGKERGGWKAGWGWLAGRDAKDGSSRKLSRSFLWGFLALHWGKEKAVDNTQAGCSGCIRQMAEGEGGREEVERGVVDVFFYVAYRLYRCWQRHTFKRNARKQTQMRCFSPVLARHTKASSCTAHVKSPNHVHAIVLHIQAYYKCERELRKSSRPGRSYCISKRNCSEAT